MSETLEPNRSSSRTGQMSELWGQVTWLLGDQRRWVYAIPVISLVAAVAELLVLVAVVRALLGIADPDNLQKLEVAGLTISEAQLLWLAAAASLVAMLVKGVESAVVGRLSSLAAANARARAVDSYFATDWRAASQLRSGRLQQLLGQNAQSASVAPTQLGHLLTSAASLALYVVFIVIASPAVGAAFAVVGGIIFFLFSLLRGRTRSSARRSNRKTRNIQLAATTLVGLNRELHLFDVRDRAREELLAINEEARHSLTRVRFYQRFVPALFQQTILLAVVGAVALARSADVDPAGFGTAAILAVRSLSYVQRINTASQAAVEAMPYIEEVRDAVEEQATIARTPGNETLDRVRTLSVEHVGFVYDDEPVLRDVTVSLAAGEWLGVVGPSGGGKTTLANLIARLLDPSEGAILVNGQPSRAFSDRSWAANFAVLSQDPVLLRGTVAQNVDFYRSMAHEDIVAAADAAAIGDVIEGLPDGWDTRVGDGEAGLSGGQRQRVALARALLGKPSVLILDEPTSALDAASEALIEASLSAVEDAIVVVVSHRPSLLRRCDRFLVMDGGRVVATGSAGDVDVERYVGPLGEANDRH